MTASETVLTQRTSQLSSAQSAIQTLQSNTEAALALIETSEDMCHARATGTGTGTVLTGYSIGYQPYNNLFSVDSSGGLTCLRAGTYMLMCDAYLLNTDSTLRWLKNGAVIEEIARVFTNKTSPIGLRVMGFSLATLAAGDVITFDITRTSATTDTCSGLNANLFKIA